MLWLFFIIILILLCLVIWFFFIKKNKKENFKLFFISQKEVEDLFPGQFTQFWNQNIIFLYKNNQTYVHHPEGISEITDIFNYVAHVYTQFWFQEIHPFLLKKKASSYYFILHIMDGIAMYGHSLEPPIMEIEKIPYWDYRQKIQKEKSIYPIFSKNKKIGVACKNLNDPYALTLLDHHFIDSKGYETILKKFDKLSTITKLFPNRKDRIIFAGDLNNGSGENIRKLFYQMVSENRIEADYHPYQNKTHEEQMEYNYILDLDGWVNAWSALFWKLLSGSLVLKHDSNWCQWYYEDLKPYVHYVPVKKDLSDLQEKLEWCRNHLEECKEIISNAQLFVKSNLSWDTSVKKIQEKLWTEYFTQSKFI